MKNSPNPPVLPFPTTLKIRLLDLLQRQEILAPSLFLEIKAQSDKEIVEIRAISEKFDFEAWKITAACDAQIWEREGLTGGRGKVDVERQGIMAALLKRSEEIDCHPITIRRNANIFSAFETFIIKDNSLDRKGFFLAALDAPDPQEAIQEFIELRKTNPNFRVRDANKWVEGQKVSDRKAKDKFGKSRSEKRLRLETHFRHAANKIQALMLSCPDQELGKKIYEPMIQDLRDMVEDMFTEDATQAVLQAWDNGHRREDQMASHTGIPKSIVAQIMQQQETEGEFYKIPQGGETEMARGRHTILWHRKNHVVGNAYSSPQLIKRTA